MAWRRMGVTLALAHDIDEIAENQTLPSELADPTVTNSSPYTLDHCFPGAQGGKPCYLKTGAIW